MTGVFDWCWRLVCVFWMGFPARLSVHGLGWRPKLKDEKYEQRETWESRKMAEKQWHKETKIPHLDIRSSEPDFVYKSSANASWNLTRGLSVQSVSCSHPSVLLHDEHSKYVDFSVENWNLSRHAWVSLSAHRSLKCLRWADVAQLLRRWSRMKLFCRMHPTHLRERWGPHQNLGCWLSSSCYYSK